MRIRWLVIGIVVVAVASHHVVGFPQAVATTVVSLVSEMPGATS